MDSASTTRTTRLLKILIIAALVVPALLFLYSTYANYESLQNVASERIERTLDELQEHTLRIFETIDRTLTETNEVLRADSDDIIRQREHAFHGQLKETQLAIPQIEAIWAFDRLGQPLVSSTIFPLPLTLNNADRDYFRAQVDRDAGTFVGAVAHARIGNSPFFVVSRRRPLIGGAFNGVVAVTVPPASFHDFYARVVQDAVVSVGLIRADGTFLATFPIPNTPLVGLASGRFVEAIAREPERGSYTPVSQIDGIERQVAYRKIPKYGVFVQAGFRTDAIWSDFWATMISHLAFGLPVTALLVGLGLLALHRK